MKNDTLIEIFEKELKLKIVQKMAPNLTEEQTLIKYFKYFDLDNSGYCAIRDWIKTVEKIGVIIPKTNDLQRIFSYYDSENKGLINYKQFANSLFSNKTSSNTSNISKQGTKDGNRQRRDGSFEKLHSYLKPKRGRFLLSLLKEFKLTDYNDSNRLNIDEFIRIITENKISLPISEVQLLFHNYDINNSGYFYYNEMFKDLIALYNNDRRRQFITSLYNEVMKLIDRKLKLADLKTVFDSSSHPLVLCNKFTEVDVEQEFTDLLESFQFIKNLVKNESNISKEDFLELFNFYGFGLEDNDFFDLLENVVVPERINQKINPPKTYPKNERIESVPKELKEPSQTESENRIDKITPLIDKLRKNIKSFGKKSLFSLIKHFKFYDNNTKLINRFDFVKVIKDFRLNLTVTEIEKIFEGLSEKTQLLNYEYFVSVLNSTLSERRQNLIEEVYKKVKAKNKDVTIDILKFYYTSLVKVENEFLNEYFDCWEIFHYILKARKDKSITLEEFVEFYQIMEFFHENDDSFENDFKIEWKKVLKTINQEDSKSTKPKAQQEIPSNQHIKPSTPLLNKKDFENVSRTSKEEERSRDSKEQRVNRDNIKVIPKDEASKNVYSLKNNVKKENVQSINHVLSKFKQILRNRGIRGLMNLHKQFLMNCSNLKGITFGDFVRVLRLQRVELSQEEFELIFDNFKEKSPSKFLDFLRFLKFFKVQLEGKRLTVVEDTFINLDVDQTGRLVMDDVRLKFYMEGHPDSRNKKRSADDVLMEFFDTFELNYNFLVATEEEGEGANLISFQEFANYYEYVSFVYENEEMFVDLVNSTWKF